MLVVCMTDEFNGLTKGKKYYVINSYNNIIKIKDDRGIIWEINKCHFKECE